MNLTTDVLERKLSSPSFWKAPMGQAAAQNKLLRVIFNSDLRCSQTGLTKLAKSMKVNVSELKVGEFVAFVNSKKNSIKLYAAGNTIAYFKMPTGKLNLKVLGIIPKFFNGRELRYDDALREVILKQIKK